MSSVGPMEPLWGFSEVAEFLRVSVETVKRWRKHREGPVGYRVGKYVRFDPAEVRAWVLEQREAS